MPWNSKSLIRRATNLDALSVAELHIESWRVAYNGLVPADYLAALDVSVRAGQYHFDDDETVSTITWLVLNDDAVAGFVTFGPSRDSDGAGFGEIEALYVTPPQWRTGVGSQLMSIALEQLTNAGYLVVTLWVLKKNSRGRRFYERMGRNADGVTTDIVVGGQRLTELRYRRSLVVGSVPN